MQDSSPESIRKELIEELEKAATEHGIDIVDVEVVGTKAQTVRVRIDKSDEEAGAITLDDVSANTGWISDCIDALDPIEDSYMLEVSSPGLARPLRRPKDFVRFVGSDVNLKTTATEGRRRYTGTLEGFEDGCVLLACDDGDVSIPLQEVKSCKIKPDFGDGGRKGSAGVGRTASGKR